MTGPAARRSWAIDLGWALAIGLTGLALRLAVADRYGSHVIGRIAWVDEDAYRSWAYQIADGQLLPDRPFYQDPLLAYLLAGLMHLAGTTEVASLRMAMACLGSLTPLAVFAAGRIGLGRGEAIVAGLATAAYGPLDFTDSLLEKEGPAALVAALALGLTMRAVAPGRGRWPAVVAGLAWGALALLRANALVVGPALAVVLLGLGGVTSRRDRWIRAAAFLGGFGAAIAPATVVNAAVARPSELILTTWQGGANFYIGNGPDANGTYLAPSFVEANPAREADDFRAEAERRAGHPLSYSASSRYWLGEGLRRWREAPGASLTLLGHKLALLLHRQEIPDNQDAEVVRVAAAPALALGFLGFGLLLPCAAIGLGRPARDGAWWVLVVATAAGLGSTALFFVVGRYRLPWVPGLALLAGAGLVDLTRLMRARRRAGVAWRVALLAAPAAFLAWRPMPDPAPDRWGHAEIGLAVAYLAAGELDPAIDALDDACALGPGPAARVADLCRGSEMHDRIKQLAAGSRATGRDPLLRARRLRHLPEFREECGKLLELEQYLHPDDPGPARELAAWSLGRPDADAGRRAAVVWLRRAKTDSPLLALLTDDPGDLPPASPADDPARATRLRLARAILRR